MKAVIEEVKIVAREIEVADTPKTRRQIENAKALIREILAKKEQVDSIVYRLEAA